MHLLLGRRWLSKARPVVSRRSSASLKPLLPASPHTFLPNITSDPPSYTAHTRETDFYCVQTLHFVLKAIISVNLGYLKFLTRCHHIKIYPWFDLYQVQYAEQLNVFYLVHLFISFCVAPALNVHCKPMLTYTWCSFMSINSSTHTHQYKWYAYNKIGMSIEKI